MRSEAARHHPRRRRAQRISGWLLLGNSVSSAPKARACFAFRGKGEKLLPGSRSADQFITEMLKVFRTGAEQQNFPDHRRKVRQ